MLPSSTTPKLNNQLKEFKIASKMLKLLFRVERKLLLISRKVPSKVSWLAFRKLNPFSQLSRRPKLTASWVKLHHNTLLINNQLVISNIALLI